MKIKVLVPDYGYEGLATPLVAINAAADERKLGEYAWLLRVEETKNWTKPDTDKERFIKYLPEYQIIEIELL